MDKAIINEDSKKIWQGATDVFLDLEKLRMVILNIKISVAKVNSEEHRALSTIADYLTESIDRIEEKTKEIRELSKNIGREINK